MTTTVAHPAPFAFVGPGSELRRTLDALLAGWEERVAAVPGPVQVVSELRGRRTATGWVPDRLYSSLQVRAPFRATTLHWSSRGGRARWATFPADPYLDALDPAAASDGEVDVLRYVPLRRCTYRAGGRVVKVKRRSRLRDSFGRAVAFSAAAARSEVRVARLRGLDERTSSYAQDDVPGVSLADLAAGTALDPLMAEAGRVHAAIHRLDAARLPVGELPRDIAAGAHASADWAAAFAPESADDLRRHARKLVARTPPVADAVLCHGDLVPSHLIGGPGEWTVIDLDLAHAGDPHRDVALFLAGLPTDVPGLAHDAAGPRRRRSAEQAYLDGYQERSGRRLDPRRLAWHRAAAELHHVGLMATKDRWHPAGLAYAVARIGEFVEEAA